MIWGIFICLFILYVIYSLHVIKNQLDVITKSLNINKKESLSNEEIERELEQVGDKNER